MWLLLYFRGNRVRRPHIPFWGNFRILLAKLGKITLLAMMTFTPSLNLFTIAFLGLHSLTVANNVPLTLIARTGTVPPGRDANYRLDGIYPPIVGRNGSIAFQALVSYQPLNYPMNPIPWFIAKPMFYVGTPQNLVWSNATEIPVATPANTTHRVLTIPTINSSGQFFGRMIYTTALAGGATQTDYGYSTGPNAATPQLIYRQDISPMEFPSYRFFPYGGRWIEQNLTDSGQVTFLSLIGITGEDTTAGIFTKTPTGNLTQVARTSQPATASVPTFRFLGEPATCNNGTIVFATTSPDSPYYTIWSRNPAGTLLPLVQRGLAAPTSMANEVFRSPYGRYQPAVAADGTTAFAATYGADGQPDKHGVFIGTPGNLTHILPPALAPGMFYTHTAEPTADTIRLNDNGTLIFNTTSFGYIGGSFISGAAILARYQGVVAPAIQSGEQAPGAPAGVTFTQFDRYEIALNNQDEILFRATVAGPGVTFGTNSSGYWTKNLATGVTRLIVRDSDVLSTGPGTSATARLSFSDSLSGLERFPSRGGGTSGPFSDTGRFVFKVRYSDLTFGLYSADTTTSPLSALAQWRLANFGSSENSGAGADTAVPGPDALPNLVRYALGLQAGENGAADGSSPSVTLEDTVGITYPVLSFKYDPAATGVKLAVSLTEDLAPMSWQEGNVYIGTELSPTNPVSTELTRAVLPDGRIAISVRGNTPVTSEARQFLRLSAVTVTP